MNLSDLLERNELSITLSGETDPLFDFEWYDVTLTEEGKRKFSGILNCAVTEVIPDKIYHVETDGNPVLEDLLAEFLKDAAGYCSNETFESLFNDSFTEGVMRIVGNS